MSALSLHYPTKVLLTSTNTAGLSLVPHIEHYSGRNKDDVSSVVFKLLVCTHTHTHTHTLVYVWQWLSPAKIDHIRKQVGLPRPIENVKSCDELDAHKDGDIVVVARAPILQNPPLTSGGGGAAAGAGAVGAGAGGGGGSGSGGGGAAAADDDNTVSPLGAGEAVTVCFTGMVPVVCLLSMQCSMGS